MSASDSYLSSASFSSKSSSDTGMEEDMMQSIPNEKISSDSYFSSSEENENTPLNQHISRNSTPRPLRVPSRKNLSVIIPQSNQNTIKTSSTPTPSLNSISQNKNQNFNQNSNQNTPNQTASGHSYNTDSIYTHSFHGKVETPKIPGPPPLKHTFLDDISTDTSELNDVIHQNLYQNSLFIKPDWKFPVEPQLKSEDDPLYENLRQKYTVKNIVSQVKHSV